MPSESARFAVLDTSVYIENFRTGRFTERIVQSRFIARCSAVVLHELLRGARSRLEKRFVSDLWRHSVVLTPTEVHWRRAAELLAMIRRREFLDAVKIRDLAFDALIALGAQSIGGTVVTCNGVDFRMIQRFLPVRVLVWG